MDINYDQFNGDALIFKYNIDEHGNPISIKVDKEEKQVSMHGTIQLEFVPDEYNRVVILNEDNSQMVEVFNRDEIKSNTYYIDYNNGIAYLDKTQFGKVKVYNYYKKGLQLIGCSRIYDEHDVTGKNVMMTLQEIIDAGKECIRILLDIGDAYQIITRLEKNIEIGSELHNTLNNDIEVGTTLQQKLHSDIVEATKWKDQLHTDVQEGKVLQPLLEQTIADGNTAKQQLDQSIADAQDDIAKIEATGNEMVNITSSEWVYNDISKMYEKQITHTCNSENLLVSCRSTDTKEALFLPWKIVDKSNILLKSDESINVSVVISARYYKALIDNTTTQEVIDARKGEVNLKGKIDKIDGQLKTVVNEINKNYDLTNEKIIHINQNLLKDKFLAEPSNSQTAFENYLKWCLDYGLKEIYVPVGTWFVDGLTINTNGIIFKGEGQYSIIKLKPNSNKNLITLKTDVQFIEFHDITLDGNKENQTNTSSILFCEGGNSHLNLHNVKIYNAYTDGIVNKGIGHCYHNVEIFNCGRFGIDFWAGDSFLNMIKISYCGQNGIVWRVGANKMFNSKIYLCGKDNPSCGAMEILPSLYNFIFVGVELQENWCNGLLLNTNSMIRFEGIVDSNGITSDIKEQQRDSSAPQRYGILMDNIKHSSFNILSNDFRQSIIGGQYNQKSPVKSTNSQNVDMIVNNINNETNADIDVGVKVLN